MIRLASYNISGGLDIGAAARVLAEIGADVVCVLEAPGSGRLRTLAREAELDVAARSGRRGSATAILVQPAVRVLATSRVPLTVPKNVPTREATHAIVGVGHTRLSVTAVQFGLRPEVRETNRDELEVFLRSVDLPTVVGADLNESVRSPVAAALAERYQDAHAVAGQGAGATYPTADPSTRQDFVFADPQLVIDRCFVVTEPPVDIASHHRPVVVDLCRQDVFEGHDAGVSPERS